MTQKTSPWVEGKYGWSYGESGWNTGMDENLLKYSFFFDKNIDGVVTSIPLPAISGKVYFNSTDNRVYFCVEGVYYSTSLPSNGVLYERSTGNSYIFNGSSLQLVDTNSQLSSRIDSVETTIGSLGTAAYQDSSNFAPSSFITNLANSSSTSMGSSLVGYKPNYTGSLGRTQAAKNREIVSLDDFGAIGNGITDDTAAIQLAFNSGAKKVIVPAGKTYNYTSLTIAVDNFELEIQSGATLYAQNATARSITVSGNWCTISGPGTIKGQAVFDGANVRPTYALVWVTGFFFTARFLTIDTIPKEGILFEDSTGNRVEGCKFIGRYPYASYDENTTTNHCAIMSNVPPITTDDQPILTVVGNQIESCIQGCLLANYDAVANNTGVTIVGNTLKNCWDHGVYMSRGKGHNISGNVFLSCRRPIVSDGIGSVVNGNVLYSELTGVKNAEQLMSVRESSDSVISNNVLYGVDAGIYVDCIETTTCNRNRVVNNIIYASGRSSASSCIRLGNGATTAEDNVIKDNTVYTNSLLSTQPVIELSMLSGFAQRTLIASNSVNRTNVGPILSVNRHSYSEIYGNRFNSSGSAGSATNINIIFLDNSTFVEIRDNKVFYTSGGTNVSVTAIFIGSGCAVPKVVGNSYLITSASLAGYTPHNFAVTTDVSLNRLDPNALVTGSFTWPTTTSSFVVSNLNVRSTSIVIVVPADAAAAAVIKDLGYFVTPGLQGFTIATATGNTTANSNWKYYVV